MHLGLSAVLGFHRLGLAISLRVGIPKPRGLTCDFLLAAALAVAVPNVAKSDELTDLKTQVQALQKRLQALEGEKARSSAGQSALTARASALPVKATVQPISLDPPVVAPNEKPEIRVAGPEKPRVELYGQAQVDAIYDAKKMDPTWQAAFRPSKIAVNCPPVGTDPGCGTNGQTTFSVRQSKFGVKGFLPTTEGVVKTQFEFDLYGMGANAGETMFHLQQAWGSGARSWSAIPPACSWMTTCSPTLSIIGVPAA